MAAFLPSVSSYLRWKRLSSVVLGLNDNKQLHSSLDYIDLQLPRNEKCFYTFTYLVFIDKEIILLKLRSR